MYLNSKNKSYRLRTLARLRLTLDVFEFTWGQWSLIALLRLRLTLDVFESFIYKQFLN